MRVWLVTVGEPLPIDPGSPRLLRTGLLAKRLVGRGHEIIWWSSTFDHVQKRHRFQAPTALNPSPGLRLFLLHGPGYPRNVSLRRWWNHQVIAAQFARWIREEPRPGLIVCSLPNLELCREAVVYGRATGTPVVLDLRDMWPDIFLDLAPPRLRWLVRPALAGIFRDRDGVCRGATALTGISPEFIDWGLAAAGRSRTPLDRHFWLAYSSSPPEETALLRARARWAALGIGPGPRGHLACFFGTMSGKLEMEPVIEAARLLERSGDRWQFVLCGAGDRLARYRRLARGLGNVVFPGWVDAAEIWTLMRSAEVGLAPYRSRPDFVASIPTKSIEYLSAGLPVVSSLKGSLEHLLARTESGLTYRNGDAAGLAEKLRSLVDGRVDRQHLARAAADTYCREFVAERVYDEMAEYLEAVAHSHLHSVA